MDRHRMHILLDTKEAAAYLEVSEASMQKWRALDRGPMYLSLTGSGHGRSVRYTIPDLAEFKVKYHRGQKKGW